MNEREALMKQVMAYAFAAHDWHLYLDTHPCDREGIAMFRKMTDKAEELKTEYVKKFGPLAVTDVTGQDGWTWINSPWPWE